MAWTNLPLADLPQVYDIMCCRFPHRQRNPGIPADPPHPVIVRHIERDEKVGEAIIHCIYGTSNLKGREAEDLVIQSLREIAAHGLRDPTRFDLADENTEPCLWTAEFFPYRYRLGSLNADCLRRMENRFRWNGAAWTPPTPAV
jgi:hypothetical protein